MALELPSDLIQQAKISTRTEAGLPDYNPDDPSLPGMPSISATVAAFDPSPPNLRCNRCQGRLLRGTHSLICIYCGHKLHQNPDAAPDPISFKSTVGYRWFLQALCLDGSEKVGAATEKNQANKGPASTHDEILLSDFLDLKIRWPTELEPEQSKSSYNSSGVDLDNFLSFPNTENISSAYKEQTVISDNIGTAVNKKDEIDEDLSLFENLRSSEPAVTSSTVQTTEDFGTAVNKTDDTHEDLSLFENLRSSKPAVTSSKVQTTDDFSGWEADFQNAESGEQNVSNSSSTPIGSAVGSGGQHEGSKPTDAFVGSDIDLSAQLDTVFGTTGGSTDGKPKDVLAVSAAANDWLAVDLWDNANSEASQKAGEVLPIVRPKDAEIANNSSDPSTSIDWFQDDTWQTHNAPAPKHDTTNGDNDSFDEWNTFTSSTPIKDPFENVLVQNDNDNYNSAGLTNFSSNLEDMDFGSFSQSDPFSGTASKESVSAGVDDNMLEVPSIFSAFGTPSKVGDSVEHTSENADIVGKSNPSKDDMDIEGIMSQMHDLSFMLETNLSIPSKSNSSLPKD